MTANEFKMAYASKGPNWWRDMMLAKWVQNRILRKCFPLLLLVVFCIALLPVAIAI